MGRDGAGYYARRWSRVCRHGMGGAEWYGMRDGEVVMRMTLGDKEGRRRTEGSTAWAANSPECTTAVQTAKRSATAAERIRAKRCSATEHVATIRATSAEAVTMGTVWPFPSVNPKDHVEQPEG